MNTYLVILRRELVQTLLNDMVTIEVLDEHDNMQAQSDDNRMNLSIVSKISLLPSVRKQYRERVVIKTRTCLALSGEEVDHFLDSPCAVHVERDIDKVLRHGFADQVALIIGRILQELLAEIIAKWIFSPMKIECKRAHFFTIRRKTLLTDHEFRKMTKCFAEDHVAMFWNTLLELLLQEAASMLVFAKICNLALQLLKTSASKTVNCTIEVNMWRYLV